MAKIDWPGLKIGEGVNHGIHLHPDFFSDLENYSKRGNLMNYKEIYQTLNDGQLDALGQTIDLVLRSKLPEKMVEAVALYPLIENKVGLNQDQMILFRDIVHYIFLNRERIKDSIYRAMKQEFFESMDRLMAEQRHSTPISDGSVAESHLYFKKAEEGND